MSISSMIAESDKMIDNFDQDIQKEIIKQDPVEPKVEEPKVETPAAEPKVEDKKDTTQAKVEPAIEEKIKPYEEKIKSYESELKTLRERNELLEVNNKLVESFKENPRGFIESNFPEFKYQSSEKGLLDKVKGLKSEFIKKYGDDFLDTGTNDPESPAFMFNYEMDKIKTMHIREEAERELAIKGKLEKQTQSMVESTRRAVATINKLKSEHNLNDEQLKPVREIHERVWNDPIASFEEIAKLYVKANYGLLNEAQKLQAQEEIEKRKKEAALASPAGGGKSGNKQADDGEWDFLLYKNSRSS